MMPTPASGQFLRRKDERRHVRLSAAIECRGISRAIEIIDFSNAGLRIDKLNGLAVGDLVTISITPRITLEGMIVWLVWHKAGIKFTTPLSESDPGYGYLLEQAAVVERAHASALGALVQQEAVKSRQSETA